MKKTIWAVYVGAFINNCAIGYVLLSLDNKEDVIYKLLIQQIILQQRDCMKD